MTQNYQALKEKGYDPNFIIISKPAKRDNIKRIFQCNYLNKNGVDRNLQHRMPLRMLVSQKARRDFDHDNKNLTQLSSRSIEDFLYNPASIQEEIFPYSYHSKRKKHNFVSSSVRMWLQNPYIRKSSISPQLVNENTDYNENCSEYDFSEKSSPRENKEDSEVPNPAIFNTSFPHVEMEDKGNFVLPIENTDITFQSENIFQDSFDTQSSPSLKKLTFPENFDNLCRNEHSRIHNSLEANCSFNFSPIYSSDSSQEKEIEFIWNPVCSPSTRDTPFNFTSEEIVEKQISAASLKSSFFDSFDLVGDKCFKPDIFENPNPDLCLESLID